MLVRRALDAISPSGSRAKLSILIFHRVHSAPDPLFPWEPDLDRFETLMDWVQDWFEVLPLGDAVARLKRRGLPARAAAITFDDGYADNLLNAVPILSRRGLSATFFIATGFLEGGRMWNDTLIEAVRRASDPAIDGAFLGVGSLPIATLAQKRAALSQLIRAVKHLSKGERSEAVDRIAGQCPASLPVDLMLNSSQVRALRAAGMGVGAHTVTHPILARVDELVARKEIADSQEALEGVLRERVGLFAYPNGRVGRDYTSVHVEIVKALGFGAALTTNHGVSDVHSDLFQLPRFTPWDRSRWRFALRLLANCCHHDVVDSRSGDPAEHNAAAESRSCTEVSGLTFGGMRGRGLACNT